MQFITTHPARIYAVFVAALALVAHYIPSLPSALVLALAAAVLGTGEAVQRAENDKTAAALAEPAPAETVDQADPFEAE
ncbi:hypothetical protein [Kitasatospora sp. NPDC092286]|uniref:hypothetical protein n=1 Tax=Kitasatospora sp. NPDC092286 TaxID=3364087 RepID=UPI00381BE337